MDPQNGCHLVCIDCWVERENMAGLMFFARRPLTKISCGILVHRALKKKETPSYTTRSDVMGENTTKTDRGGYVIGLGVNYSSRGRANVGSGDEQSEATTTTTTTKTASGVCPSESASEESASETPTEEPTTHKPTYETASHLPK